MTKLIRSIILPLVVFTAVLILIVSQPRRGAETGNRGEAISGEALEATAAMQAFRWYNDMRAFPAGTIPLRWREDAREQIRQAALLKTGATQSVSWIALGPDNIGGRVRSIALHPTDHSLMYCGSVSGGIWKSTNAGASWSPTNDFAASLVIGAMVLDPTNPNVIYAGTGEGYFNVDALRGAGVLKSTDGGSSWSLLTSFSGSPRGFPYYINDLYLRPDSVQTLFAATNQGLFKTTNGGASWIFIKRGDNTYACTQIVADKNNPRTMYVAFGNFVKDGIYKSTNGGSTWNKLTNGFPTVGFYRISMAIAPSNPQVLYACLTDSATYNTHSIQKSTDGGASWNAVQTPFDNSTAVNTSHLGGQGWYNNVMAVHPTDENTVFAGGINLFKTVNGGTTWNRISDGYGNPFVHVDQHAILIDPSVPSTVYFGNDGGMFKSTDGGVTFSAINNGLAITQFYSVAAHPSSEIFYGGTQDNGTIKSAVIPSWQAVLGGDGGATAVDYFTPNIVYTEYVNLCVQKSVDGGANWSRSISGIPPSGNKQSDGTSDRCSFIAPLVMDPTNPLILVAGTYRVFRSTDGAASWTPISSDLTGSGPGSVGSTGGVISAIGLAKSSTSTIYIGTFGTDTVSSAPKIQVSSLPGGSWTWSDVTKLPLPKRAVASIAVDPTNASRAIAGYSGYNINTPGTPGHVFRTTNRGTTWTNISGNLPDLPVNTVLLDPASPSTNILAGTDLGIFETTDGGVTWLPVNAGLANVAVFDLRLRPDRYVVAATHGRGIFKSSAPLGTAQSTALSIILHQNPLLSRYIDFYVTSDESLSTVPGMQVSVSGGSSQSVSLNEQSRRIFKGTYELTSSGTVTATVSAADSASQVITASRVFQALLFKEGIPGTLPSADARLVLHIASDAIAGEQYLTVVAGDIPREDATAIRSDSYSIGPAMEFSSRVQLSFAYEDILGSGEDARHLMISQKDPSGWVPVATIIDVATHRAMASIHTSGTFRLEYRPAVESVVLPAEYRLLQNYPNPFNPSTTIRYVLPSRAQVALTVYDIEGREVRRLVNDTRDAGSHEVVWDGRDASGQTASTGIYFYRIHVSEAGHAAFEASGKMIFMK